MYDDEPTIFNDLVGKPDVYAFYGVCNNSFKLGDVVFEAIEDESDGYRSYLDTIALSSGGIFSKQPLAYVQILYNKTNSDDGYYLYSPETDHTWLWVGTENTNDWYPYFVFNYIPDTTQTSYANTSLCPKQLYPELFI